MSLPDELRARDAEVPARTFLARLGQALVAAWRRRRAQKQSDVRSDAIQQSDADAVTRAIREGVRRSEEESMHRKPPSTTALAVLVVGLALAGCGVQAPRATVSVSDDRILAIDGPSIRGSVSDPDGVEIAGGALWVNPAAAVAEGIRLLSAGVGQLLGLVTPATAAPPLEPGAELRDAETATMPPT